MRKITKASLAELKESLPVLNEQEKAEYVGGDYYFVSGTTVVDGDAKWIHCLQNTFIGDQIRFVRLDPLYMGEWDRMSNSEKRNASVGINHSSVSSEAVRIILSNMLADNPAVQKVVFESGDIGTMYMGVGSKPWITQGTYVFGDSSSLPLTVAGFSATLREAGSGALNPNLPGFNGPGNAIRAIPGM